VWNPAPGPCPTAKTARNFLERKAGTSAVAPSDIHNMREGLFEYTKRGFEVVGQTDFDGHTLTGMVRQPVDDRHSDTQE
jgi:hypothetical protein